jgi:hypothetical protein
VKKIGLPTACQKDQKLGRISAVSFLSILHIDTIVRLDGFLTATKAVPTGQLGVFATRVDLR